MVKNVFVLLVISGITFFYSCSNSNVKNEFKSIAGENRILQQDDGTISLKVDKAECYHDKVNPESNTAVWNVLVSKSGRFNVWLSSATKDTTNLQYKNNVMLSVLDNTLEAHPECDKIILNSNDVRFPYFRADSFMGALYIQDTGLFNIQIISEKIVPNDYKGNQGEPSNGSKLLSVILKPITR